MISFNLAPLREPTFVILSVIIIILLIFGMTTGLSGLSEKKVETRKKTVLLIWLIPVMIFSIPFSASLLKYHHPDLIYHFVRVVEHVPFEDQRYISGQKSSLLAFF